MNAKFRAVSYRRDLPKAIVTSHGSYRTRDGVIIRLSDDSGHTGIGDAAPLPGFSRETFEELGRGLTRLVGGLRTGGFDHFQRFYETTDDIPSLIFGLGTALEDLAARAQGVSLCRWLASNAASHVKVNGLLGDGAPTQMAKRAQSLVREGFTTLKVKVAAGSAKRDIERINAIADAAPAAQLRLDANGGWTAELASEVLSNVPIERIEFVEQPLPVGNVKESWRLCGGHGVKLALDEEVSTVEDAKSIIERRACDAIVLKPMILGSFRAPYLLALAAQKEGMSVVYTSSWESDVGIAATLHLAAALGPDAPAMGLSTAGSIAKGIVAQPLRIESGAIRVPHGLGLGVELASEILQKLM